MHTRRWQDFNVYLFISVIVLLGFGVAMVYSTTVGAAPTGPILQLGSQFTMHLIWLGIGAIAMIAFTLLDYHIFQLLARPLYVITLLILAYTLVAGKIAGGAQSWLVGSSGQPSEAAKLLLIIALAAWWSSREERGKSWITLGGSLLLAGVPLLLVLAQPDFGTAMVIGVVWFVMACTAGITWKQLAALLLIALPVLYVGWTEVLQPYQRGRLTAFTMDESEISRITDKEEREAVQAAFYNGKASKVTVGNGGLLGRGLLRGTQSQRNFLPVQYTDFIFAVTAEELGFVGAVAMLGLLSLVLWQTVNVAGHARDRFGRLIAIGTFAMLLIHTLENIGMNMGLMPITGIPLPFISYGGSFTITVLAAIGILQSIELRRRALVF